jgi:hypothetical protein
MASAVRRLGSLSMARGCARIDAGPDTAKIGSADRVQVHHARLLAVIGVRKTFPHGLDPKRPSPTSELNSSPLKRVTSNMQPEPHATSRGVAPTFCDVSRHTLMLVGSTRNIRSVRHQCWFGHRGKHPTCRPAKNKFSQPGMPVPAHDNEIGIRIGCI